MYEALEQRNADYDGLFFYGVKSTGIFCRPSCPSKVPKRENVVFFKTAADAMQAGFRPCKRCRSDLLAYHPMEEIAKATHEGAVGNTTVAEKVTDVAQKANDILEMMNASMEGAENLKKQVAKFKV